MAPSWPGDNDWISVVTDADEGFVADLEIREVYFDMDATYLYVRIRLEDPAAPVLLDHTWWIYLDTNGDGTNDWVVVDMSNTTDKQVHGLAWSGGSGTWGVAASDWYDTLIDTDDDSAIRSVTWTIALEDYGCVDFAVLRSHIGSISDSATITAADNDVGDTNMSGKTENAPNQALSYVVDCTDAGDIPEFEAILAPILLMIIVPTVMIKRRKRYLGSQTPRGGTRWRSASSESQTWESQPSSQRQP